MVTKEAFCEVIENLHDLPTLPSVVERVMKAANDPDIDVTKLAEEIALDPVLTAKILRVVNSSFYSLRRQISSVREATTILGLGAIGAIALTSSVVDRLKIQNQSGLFYRGLFWAHSIGTAVCAESIARASGYERADVVFTGAMVHDIGKVVLDRYFPEEFLQVLSETRRRQARFSEIESSILPMSHAELGYHLALKWGLSEMIALSIRHHHGPGQIDPRADGKTAALCTIVAAGNNVCGSLAIGSSGNWKKIDVDYDLLERAGLNAQKAATLLQAGHDISARVQGFMQTVGS